MAENKKNRLGTYVRCSVDGESYQAFVPPQLPPEPAVNLIPLQWLLSKANQALARLNLASDVLPDSGFLLYYYVRQESVSSSQIEGIQSSLSDILLYESNEIPSAPIDDVVEVSSYVAALEHGLKRVAEGFPLCLPIIHEMHKILLSAGRGRNKRPGEFRTSQNWIGGTRPANATFIPVPAEHLMNCLDDLEKYLQLEQKSYTSLIDAGLIHAQFETIHPFLDGNGRIGRLLIVIFLVMMGDLRKPDLYLSLFFRNNRSAYYERLAAVRSVGDWEGWLKFFLTGIIETADQVVETSQAILSLFKEDNQKITVLKRASVSAHQAHKLLQKKAVVNAIGAAQTLDMSVPTTRKALNNLKHLGIVKEISGSGNKRLYIYENFIDLLEKRTESVACRRG